MKQIACVLAPVVFSGGKYRAQFPALQEGESTSGAITELPYVGSLLADDPLSPVIQGFSGFARFQGQASLGVCIVYAEAENTRLDAADALAQYHIFWRWTIDRSLKPASDTEKSPFKSPASSELTALRDYLALQTGKSATVVTSWFAQLFEVSPAQAVAWATARPRYATITKLGQAFYDWNTAKSQLDALG